MRLQCSFLPVDGGQLRLVSPLFPVSPHLLRCLIFIGVLFWMFDTLFGKHFFPRLRPKGTEWDLWCTVSNYREKCKRFSAKIWLRHALPLLETNNVIIYNENITASEIKATCAGVYFFLLNHLMPPSFIIIILKQLITSLHIYGDVIDL